VGAIVNEVTGMGHVFLSGGARAIAQRARVNQLYPGAHAGERARVIFQNPDDILAFTSMGLVSPQRTALIRGSGVDTSRYSPRETREQSSVPIVLMVGRLIAEKGVFEFVEAARSLQQTGVTARFAIAGGPDPGNPSSIPEKQLAEWRSQGVVELCGHVEPIDDLLASATIVALPSYREGLPVALLEATAMAKPVIAADVPGCREVVLHDVTGLLVPVRDAKALAAAIQLLLGDSDARERMGKAGRERALRLFSDERVVAETLAIYEELLRPVELA
jgi:glycosyltransferase involved in cell wall biosynthesis